MTARSALVAAAMAIVLCLLPACRRQAQQAESNGSEVAVPVFATAAQTGAIRTVVRAAGAVTAPPDAEFLAMTLEPSTVVDLPWMEGAIVATGEVLVRLNIPSATQNVIRQQAEVARAQATVENARTSQARTRDLVERGLVPRLDLENADREVTDAQAALARAEAARVAAETAAARAEIKAPFTGIVAKRFHNPGDALQGVSSDPILRLVDAARLEVTATVAAEDAGRVAQGATARIAAVTDAPAVRLTVASRESQRPDTGDVVFRLVFNEPATIAIDTAIQLDIDAEERMSAVFVPAEAVVREGGMPYVYVTTNGRAAKRPVETGLEDETRIEILKGVTPGELVLTQGHIGLADGAAISIDTTAR